MTGRRPFCSVLSQEAGESLAGTGRHPARSVLVQWPKARWRHSLRIADGMSPEIVAALEASVAGGRRVNLIDRKGEWPGLSRVMLTPEHLAFDVAPDALPRLLSAVTAGAGLAGFRPRPMPKCVLLCCTHGRHDRCCAKFGFATYCALEQGGRDHAASFDVWESTHLGECRLSASVLSLPSRRKYGRVGPADIGAFLEAGAADRPFLPAYRGGADLEPPAQAAEVMILSSGIDGPLDIRRAGGPDDAPRYVVRAGGRVVNVACRPDAVATYGACADIDVAKTVPLRRIWRAEMVGD